MEKMFWDESESPLVDVLPCGRPQITLQWAEQQVQNTQSLMDSISFLQSLASQSPLGEVTLNLVTVSPPTSESAP